MPFEKTSGIGKTTANQLRSILKANRDGSAKRIPAVKLPKKTIEIYIDMEFLSSVRIQNSEWPQCADGLQMVFMIGVGVVEGGEWRYRQFVAGSEDHDSERVMFTEFLSFLTTKGVFERKADAALYHWSPAEPSQAKAAAARLSMPRLEHLPWIDLLKIAKDNCFAVAGCLDYSLKSVARAVSAISPHHRIEWPETDSGLSAMVAGFRMYDSCTPLETREYKLLSEYLEVDVKAMKEFVQFTRESG